MPSIKPGSPTRAELLTGRYHPRSFYDERRYAPQVKQLKAELPRLQIQFKDDTDGP